MQDKQPRKSQYIDGFVRRPAQPAPIRVVTRVQTKEGQAVHVAHPRQNPAPEHTQASTGSSPLLLNTQDRRRTSGLQRSREKEKKRFWKRTSVRLTLAVLALLVIGGGWLSWKFYQNTSKVFGNKNPLQMLSVFKPVPLKGQDSGHVNILLAGDSAGRSDGGGGAELTDSIMLVSINTSDHTASMLSIPRDLYINTGTGHQKINAANSQSDFHATGYPNGGMGALEKVITDNLGIPLNYYVLVNYDAFQAAVNDVGGIDVNIQSEDPRGIYDPSILKNEGGPLKLPNGVSHLNGQAALNLARARGDPFNGVRGAYGFPQSDFDRTAHQRAMMLALKEKASSTSVLSNPVKLGQLMDAIGSNVKTDFQLNEITSLYYMMKGVNSSNIQSLSLNNADGKNLLANYTSPDGQSTLIPAAGLDNFTGISQYMIKKFSGGAAAAEDASVVVLNGGQTAGLAKVESSYLATKGISVSQTGNAPSSQATTTIIDNSQGQKPKTKSLLGNLVASSFTTNAAIAKQYSADFIVVLGANQQAPSGSSTAATGSSTTQD